MKDEWYLFATSTGQIRAFADKSGSYYPGWCCEDKHGYAFDLNASYVPVWLRHELIDNTNVLHRLPEGCTMVLLESTQTCILR